MTSQEMQYFMDVLREVRSGEKSQFISTKQYIQHGKTSVYRHSVSVAYISYRLAKKWNWKIDERALLRGALLHDYFLYDWHEKIPERRLHGFYHPGRALKNADADFELGDVERDIIKNHMFPMTIYLPRHRETLLVSMVDKWISTIETLRRRGKKTTGKSEIGRRSRGNAKRNTNFTKTYEGTAS